MVSSTQPVVANKQVGNIAPGDDIIVGTTLQEFIEQMVTATFEPTFTGPSTSLTYSGFASSEEIGTTGDILLTATFNKGTINGVMNNPKAGVWNPNASQGPRAGTANAYTIDSDTVNSTANIESVTHSITIAAGPNHFDAHVAYDASTLQPVNSKGANFDTTFGSGTTNDARVTINGYRKYFYGSDAASNPTLNSDYVRALTGTLNPSSGTKFTINIASGAKNVVFAYPQSLGAVSSVIYVEGMSAQVKGIFGSPTTVTVKGAGTEAGVAYNVYKYTPAVPFQAAATYEVTI